MNIKMDYMVRRICATILDYFIMPIVFFYLEYGHSGGLFSFLYVNNSFFLIIFYFFNIIMYLTKGKTLGYLLFGLKIVGTNGEHDFNILNKVFRFFLKIAYLLSFFIPSAIAWVFVMFLYGAGHGDPNEFIIFRILLSKNIYPVLIPIVSIVLISIDHSAQLPYEKFLNLKTVRD